MLCLDMNQWIYLARAHYGRKPTPGALSALQDLRELVIAIVARHTGPEL